MNYLRYIFLRIGENIQLIPQILFLKFLFSLPVILPTFSWVQYPITVCEFTWCLLSPPPLRVSPVSAESRASSTFCLLFSKHTRSRKKRGKKGCSSERGLNTCIFQFFFKNPAFSPHSSIFFCSVLQECLGGCFKVWGMILNWFENRPAG